MSQKLKRVIRLDSQPLNQTFFTEEGYLRDRPILTSTGIFEYTNDDGSTRRELRLPEEVFDPESLKSYQGKPVIVTHDAGLVTKNNVAENQIGTILSEGYRSGDDVRAEIIIHDTDEMKASGLRELSLGYNLDLDETPGVWEGEPYDAIQRNIRINHLALVREARAGEQARLNIDGRDSTIKGGKAMSKVKHTKKTSKAKKTHRNDGILSPDELKKAIEEYKARRGNRPASQEDDDEEEVIIGPSNQDDDDDSGVGKQIQYVKDCRNRRDEEGDPSNMKEAKGVIAQQDEDIDILFDIIDTLLAKMAFCEDDDEEIEITEDDDELTEDDDDDFEEDDDDDELAEDDDDDFEEDDDDDELAEDDDDDFEEDDDEDFEEDDDEDFEEDDDDDDVPFRGKSGSLKTDSIDRIVKERVQIAKVASILNMDGLENRSPMKAKKAIIHRVKPGIRLDGKSKAYINAMFDLSCDAVAKATRKDTMYQRKQMFNNDSRYSKSGKAVSVDAARAKMIKRMQNPKKSH